MGKKNVIHVNIENFFSPHWGLEKTNNCQLKPRTLDTRPYNYATYIYLFIVIAEAEICVVGVCMFMYLLFRKWKYMGMSGWKCVSVCVESRFRPILIPKY